MIAAGSGKSAQVDLGRYSATRVVFAVFIEKSRPG